MLLLLPEVCWYAVVIGSGNLAQEVLLLQLLLQLVSH